MNFIGIDLAWTYKNETGICVISDDGHLLELKSHVFSNEEIADIVERYSNNEAIVAIDAPLIVKNQVGARECDGRIMKEKIHGRNLSVFTCSRDYLVRTYGQIRGEDLVNLVRAKNPQFEVTPDLCGGGYKIIETFPTGICLGLFPDEFPIKYKLKNKVPYIETQNNMLRMIKILNRMSHYVPAVYGLDKLIATNVTDLSKAAFKHLEDKIDAFLCAYSAYWCFINQGEGRIFGNKDDGFILLPVEKTIQRAETYSLDESENDANLIHMLEAVRQFHISNGFDVATKSQETMLYRMSLLMEELGEISQCLTKGKGNIAEEHAELLILLLGNCITMDIDIVTAFWDKYRIIVERKGKKVGKFSRVSEWNES